MRRTTPSLGSVRRQAVGISSADWVDAQPTPDQSGLPLLVRPRADGVDLVEWARANRDVVEQYLAESGAALFRGFGMRSADRFRGLVEAAAGAAEEYRERSSPRSEVADRIYTSTEYPPDQRIFLHNENSYQHVFPLRLFFCCLAQAERGGETSVADCRRVWERLPAPLRDRFLEREIMYVRNFGDGAGLSWQTVFQTAERNRVEDYCREAGIGFDWKHDGGLRTRQVRPAAAVHPRTSETVWFNHAAFFHVSTLEPTLRDALLTEYAEEDLPMNSYYGDGAPIEPAALDVIREAYERETAHVRWEAGDLLIVDNVLCAHGREPFVGRRQVLVAMAESTRHSRWPQPSAPMTR